ncbi:FAD/NAD(P)-binding protein [Lichenicola sp.]|uniref:FAD/NAD(P)-binding protein n=1 Tax=Lichenicola sp. TaxID=2804529 RepID=UPI003B00D900
MDSVNRQRADVILVGAGLSGAAFAAHLMRDHPDLRARLAIIEPAARLGAGLAYGTTDPVHRTNVSASRMSLFPDLPDHCADWLADRDEAARDPAAATPDGRLHVRRAVYGDYVEQTLRAQIAGSRLDVRHLRDRAVSGRRGPDGGWEIELDDGERLQAPILVLGVSHTKPDLPGVLAPLRRDTRMIVDPWDTASLARIDPRDTVLVVGTGLTGCDTIASLRNRGHRGQVLAVSRRGLLPRPRTTQPVAAAGEFATAPSVTALELLLRVRAAMTGEIAAGRPWENVIDAIRGQARTIWGSLPIPERRRVLRHLRPFWDVHRFQCAPQIEAVLLDGSEAGWLTVMAATIEAATAGPGGIEVRLRQAHGRGTRTVTVGAIVNCTGPGHRSVVASHPLLHALAEEGALRADPCRLGIDVTTASQVIAADGHAWPDLFVVGPLARGTHGELMGLPQVTLQPREVADAVAGLLEPPLQLDAATPAGHLSGR